MTRGLGDALVSSSLYPRRLLVRLRGTISVAMHWSCAGRTRRTRPEWIWRGATPDMVKGHEMTSLGCWAIGGELEPIWWWHFLHCNARWCSLVPSRYQRRSRGRRMTCPLALFRLGRWGQGGRTAQ